MASRIILLAEETPATAGFLTDNLAADSYRVLLADDNGRRARGARAMGS
jgi:hypothetical protein